VQDLDRGLIIGRRSFGKGLVMSDIRLMDGSSLRLSMARYYTPSGRCVQKPYTNDIFAYETEIYERFLHRTEMEDTTSSNTKIFHTKKGKIVKGGGGIYPDVFVPIDTNYDLKAFAELRNDIPEFIYQQMPNIKLQLTQYESAASFQKNYTIDESLFNHYIAYIERQKNPSMAKVKLLDKKLKIMMKAYIARQMWNNEGFYRIINEMDATFETAVRSL
jgi:carboxyl-terminal processing protease